MKTIEAVKPTAMIGVSSTFGAFSQWVVNASFKLTERRVIFALTKPTNRCECTVEQTYTRWAARRYSPPASSSQTSPTRKKQFHLGQAMKFYVLPVIGLATYCARPQRLIDEYFIVAALAGDDPVGTNLRGKGMLFPSQSDVLQVKVTNAVRIVGYMFDQGMVTVERPRTSAPSLKGSSTRRSTRRATP